MGQQSSVLNFCRSTCSACPCSCCNNEYTELDKIGLMNDVNKGNNYQSNAKYDEANEQEIIGHRDEKTKFRAFIIAYHREYGYLLLRAYKKGKGVHHQLPGGHIDKSEFHNSSLEEAAKNAAKRELFEETGINLKEGQRLKFLKLGIKNRIYFQILLKNEDSLTDDDEIHTKSLNDEQSFYLKLSDEHNGFEFVKDIEKAIKLIVKHSGGKNSDALSKYSKLAKHERKLSLSKEDKKSTKNKKDKKDKKKKKKKNKQKKDKEIADDVKSQ